MNKQVRKRIAQFAQCVLAISLLAGCKASTTVQMKMSVAPDTRATASEVTIPPGSFFTNGFPTDLRVKSNGKADISDFPRRVHLLTNAYVKTVDNEVTGYSPLLPIYIPFTAPILTGLMSQDEMDYARDDAAVQLIDVDSDSPEYGRRFPLNLKMTAKADQYRPGNLLQALPMLGVNLRPNTTYALIVTDQVPVAEDLTIVQDPQLQTLLDPESGAAAVSERALAVYAPLRALLETESFDKDSIIGATVWTTAEMKTRMRTGAAHVAAQPAAAAKNVTLLEEFDDYCVIQGFVDVPGYQKGAIPYPLTGGKILFNSDNTPIQQYTRSAEWIITIPKHSPMPASGFPILSFHHGAGGNAEQVFTRGAFLRRAIDIILPYSVLDRGNGPSQVAAERGWASSGFAGHMSMDHLGVEGGGYGLFSYDMFNPVAFKYNYYQMVWERIYFRHFLASLKIDASLCPDAIAGDGNSEFRIDPDMQVSMGQSLGNWTSSLQVANDPDPFEGVIFTGIAGTWLMMFIDDPSRAVAFELGVVSLLPGEHLDIYHPFLALLEWVMSDVDPTLYMDEIFRNPVKTAPHVMAISGIDDHGSSEVVQRTFLTALGLDLAGEELGTTPDSNLLAYLQKTGTQQLPYPVVNNISVPGQGQRTGAIVRYENTVRPDHNGHHVTFDIPAPKHQYGCFMQNLAEGRAPVIVEGSVQNGPCL